MDCLPQLQVVVLASAGIGLCLFAARWLDKTPDDVKRLTRPSGSNWFWGHMKMARESVNLEFFLQATEEVGHTVALNGAGFNGPTVVIADPEALRYIFVTHMGDYSTPNRPSGKGMAHHRLQLSHQRHHLFAFERITVPETRVWEVVDRVTQDLRTLCVSSGSNPSSGSTVDILQWTELLSLAIMERLILDENHQAEHLQASYTSPTQIKTNVKSSIEMALRSKGSTGSEKIGGSFLQDLSTLKDTGANLEALSEQLSSFIIDGAKTLSNTVALACYELARNADLQTRLRREMAQLAGYGSGSKPKYNELQGKLPMLDAVCKETSRMYPAVSHLERVATKDDTIPLRYSVLTTDAEYIDYLRVKKGQVFHVPVALINRNRTMWGAHGYEWFPGRWLDSNMMPTPYLLTSGIDGTFTFSEGPRMCPAHRLVGLELKIALFAIIQAFELRESGATIEIRDWPSIQPHIAGQAGSGPRLPINIRPINA